MQEYIWVNSLYIYGRCWTVLQRNQLLNKWVIRSCSPMESKMKIKERKQPNPIQHVILPVLFLFLMCSCLAMFVAHKAGEVLVVHDMHKFISYPMKSIIGRHCCCGWMILTHKYLHIIIIHVFYYWKLHSWVFFIFVLKIL
jgi:hypothetical protein